MAPYTAIGWGFLSPQSRDDTPKSHAQLTFRHRMNMKRIPLPLRPLNAVSLSNFPIPRRDGNSPNRSEEETYARGLGRRPCGHHKTQTHRKRNLTPASSSFSSSSPFYYCPSSSSSTFHRLGTHLVTPVFVRTLLVPRYLTRGHGGPASSVATAKQKRQKQKHMRKQSSTATVPLSACFHPADLERE
jgi:hypothetical protein